MRNGRRRRESWMEKGNVFNMTHPAFGEGSQRSQSKTWGVVSWEGRTRHGFCHVETSRLVHRGDGSQREKVRLSCRGLAMGLVPWMDCGDFLARFAAR